MNTHYDPRICHQVIDYTCGRNALRSVDLDYPYQLDGDDYCGSDEYDYHATTNDYGKLEILGGPPDDARNTGAPGREDG